ncbi:MAG: sulfatase-like hydrolase/transferase [Myxococcota bacterium]
MASGAWVGAAAGLILAFGDFGASWLWLPWWPDRAALLGRLLATEVPMGALAGATLGAFGAAVDPGVRRLAQRWRPGDAERFHRRLWPLPFVALAAGPLLLVAHKLFQGGMTSTLPARPLLVAVSAAILCGGAYLALRVGRWLVQRAATGGRGQAGAIAAILFAAHLAVTKIDQHVLPRLYEYLHVAASVAAFVLAAAVVMVGALRSRRLRAAPGRHPAAGWALLGGLTVVLGVSAATLDHNQNVRVALYDPRASNARSLMQGLDPLYRTLIATDATEATARARRARARRRAAGVGGLPVWTDAHVLLITIDALRADHLGTHGYERPTSKHIDALARDSVVFEQAYAAAPHSSYSLSSLMTSEYLHETVEIGRPPPSTTLAGAFGDAGFHTAAFYTNGIFHTEGERVQRYHDTAFDFARHDHGNAAAEKRTDRVLAEIDRVLDQGEPPSFLWAHYFDVHEPYRDESFGTSPMDRYDGEIRKVDRALGRLLREARQRLSKDLIVVLTADHGEEFRDHGGIYHGSTAYEEQIRVPLMLHAPDLEPRRIGAPVSLVDVAPTLLGMLGMPVPSTMRGQDLRPLATGRIDDAGPAFAGVMHKRMVVRWPHKLIADLRFDLVELYDLDADPKERNNLADRRPEVVDELRGEIHAWLDALQRAPNQEAPADPRQRALARGHLGDRRALEPLAALVLDDEAPTEMRCEAARILGDLADEDVAGDLARAIRAPEPQVAAEAAIALGRLRDSRARPMLRHLMHGEDVDLRTRAAVSLGRLGESAAVPALIEATTAARTKDDRREAVRLLGRLGDARALQPLLDLIPELRMRRVAIVALGKLGDPRAYEPLLEVLDWEHRPNIRSYVARALGTLGNPEAIDRLRTMAATESQLHYIGESLVRLGAPRRGAVGGTDVGPGTPGLRGFGACHATPPARHQAYAGRTWCPMESASASIRAPLPSEVREAPAAVALVRMRRLDVDDDVAVELRFGDRAFPRVQAGSDWAEHRFSLDADDLEGDRASIRLRAADDDARLAIDHVLIVPRPAEVAAQAVSPSPR